MQLILQGICLRGIRNKLRWASSFHSGDKVMEEVLGDDMLEVRCYVVDIVVGTGVVEEYCTHSL